MSHFACARLPSLKEVSEASFTSLSRSTALKSRRYPWLVQAGHGARPLEVAARPRLLVCTPFTPRLDARHGGKATAQLLLRLAERNHVALLSLRGKDEKPVDRAIATRCAHVEEVAVAANGRVSRRLAWGIGVLRGLPPWATDCRSADYRSALERLLDEWRPDIVEIHLQVMAQYVDAAARRNLPRILVDYDPGSAWANDLLEMTKGPRRLVRRLAVAGLHWHSPTNRPLRRRLRAPSEHRRRALARPERLPTRARAGSRRQARARWS